MPTSEERELREHRERIVREHMESENVHQFDRTMATFKHPRYELIATGAIHDGEAEVAEYFRASRTAFPDQRNELIAPSSANSGCSARTRGSLTASIPRVRHSAAA